MKYILISFIFLVLSSCSSAPSAELPDYDVSVESVTSALLKFKESDNNILYLLLVDIEGNVVRIKKVESKVKSIKQQEYRSIEYVLKKQLKFNKISSGFNEYRTIFHAINHKFKILK